MISKVRALFGWSIMMVMCLGLMSHAALAAQASSDQDPQTGYVRFNFDGASSVKIAPSSAVVGEACNLGGDKTGGLRYNTGLKKMEYCNGTLWQAIGDAAPVGLACETPTKGALRYNDSLLMMEYCDGTSWKAIGAVPDDGACVPSVAGMTRFVAANTHLEYCDGSAWQPVAATKLAIDYPRCMGSWFPARFPKSVFPDYKPIYKARGAASDGTLTVDKMDILCPPDMVVVTADNNHMSYVYCCPLRVE